jgi:hypothetical membrane protein
MKKSLLVLPISNLAVPLIMITVSIALSPWFNIVKNALSDLGHATRSSVAPLFNLGLSLGGVLAILTATILITRISKALAISICVSGYFLILVAVFDEVYGKLHYWVSVAFFLSLGASLIIYSLISRNTVKRVSALVLLIVAVTSWVLHIYYRIPSGAAIPELISIFAIAPFYIDISLKSLEIQRYD